MDIDTSSYQQELDLIYNDAKAVLARMDHVKSRFDEVATKVETIETSLGNVKTTIDHRVGETATHIETFFKHAEDTLANSQVGDHFKTALDAFTTKLTELESQFTQKTAEVYGAIEKSHTVLQQVGEAVKHAHDDVHDNVTQGVQAVQENLNELKQKFDSTSHPALTTFDDFLHSIREQAEAHTNETHDHLEALRQQTDEHMHQQLFDPLHAHLGETAEKLGQIATGDVDARLHAVLDHGREQLENQGKQVIANLVDKVAQELDQVMDHIHQAGQGSAIPREAMKPILDSIDGLLKPVEETIGNVKSIASAVGFDV